MEEITNTDRMEYNCEYNEPGPSNINCIEEQSTRCSNCKKSVNESVIEREHERYVLKKEKKS